MKIAVFGGNGFIGRAVGERLRQNGHSFFEVSRNATDKGAFKADITDYNSLKTIEQQADVVIICTATLPKKTYSVDDVNVFIEGNITGIHNVLKWALERGVSRVIYCSTLSMVPTAEGTRYEKELIDISSHYLYKITKATGEHLVMGFCREHQLHYYVLRITSVYGKEMKKDIIDLIAGKIERSEKFVITDHNAMVDYIHVKDVAKTIVACLFNANTNRIINVASGRNVKLKELAEIISRILGKRLEIEVKSENSNSYLENNIEAMIGLIGNEVTLLEQGLQDLLLKK